MIITNGTQVKIGTVGYVVSLDLSAYDISVILGVQVKNAAGWSSPVTDESAFEVLAGYINNALAPDMAFCWMRGNLFVFVKAAYTYVSTTLVTFWYYRNAQNVTAVSDTVDIPGEMEQLALALILRKVYLDQNTSLPQNIASQIRTQCTNLNITYPI
jgi:hypothetical protein